jgi:protein ImuB
MRLLHLAWPHLPLRLARATSSSFPSGPVILGGQPWDPGTVLDANLEARAFGVRRGLPLGEAHKLAPEATFVSVDPDVARAAFERALDALGAFSPAVEGEPDPTADGFGTAYLGIEGLDRLWGGERRLVERIAETLEPLLPGPPRAGIAATRFGASVAALTARYELPGCRVAFAAIASGAEPGDATSAEATFLAPLPLDLLPADDETRSRFRLFGLRRMGELAALPRSAVLARFGEQGGFLHALAGGTDPRPLSPRTSPQRLIAEVELDPPVESREPLRFVLRRLLVGLCAQLAARGRAAGAVRLRLIPESDGARARESIEILIALPEPSAEPESIERLLVGRLESVPIDHPIGRLAVELERVSESVGRQLPLFVPQAARAPGLEWQLARLALRFGPDRVRQARIEDPDARLPEDRFRWLEAATGLSQPTS